MMKKESPERVPAEEHYTVEEYLSFERAAVDVKHEYLDGLLIVMAGASRAHNLITGNIAQRLANQLERTSETYLSNMRVKTTPTRYTYPDVVVVCQEPQFEDEELDTLVNPTVIVEVLSPSTKARDRGEKFFEYRALPSVKDYLVVSQDTMHVEHYTRQSGDEWMLHDVTAPEVTIPNGQINRSCR